MSKEEPAESFEVHRESNDASESVDTDKEKLDNTPVSGLLKEHKKTKVEADESEEVVEKKALTNETITAALKKRAKYLKTNSEYVLLSFLLFIGVFCIALFYFLISISISFNLLLDCPLFCKSETAIVTFFFLFSFLFSRQLTLAGLRRLLEEDLELEAHALDPYKKFIREQVDEVSRILLSL